MYYALIFLILSIVSVILYNIFNFYRYRQLKIDAFLCLSVGYVYYWIIPGLAIIGFFDLSDPALEIVRDYIKNINEESFILFCLIGWVLYTSFFMGYIVFKVPANNDFAVSQTFFPNKLYCKSIIFLAVLLVLVCAYPIQDQFFRGYSAELFVDYSDGVTASAIARGRFTASTVFLFITILIYISYFTQGVKGFLFNKYILLYLIFSIMAVSLGGRLYFISTLFTLLIYVSVYRNAKFSVSKVLIFGFSMVFLMTAYGAIRAGDSFKISNALLNLLQEPLLTSLSLFSYLSYDNEIWFGNYYLFLADLINIIPSSLLPNKLEWLIDPRNMGYHYEMPLGGMHIYVSGSIKLGIILLVFVSFLWGLMISFLQKKGYRNKLYSVCYVLISGWLVFSFFRDPFYVSLVKNIFEFSILIPIILIWIGRLLIIKRRSNEFD